MDDGKSAGRPPPRTEPTSAMDPRAEHLVIGRFKELAAGKIAIFVTRGRVREEGDFQTLMSHDGLFAELYRLSQDR
ncbi:hypothetical protein [Streptomyces sp. NPDC004270]